MKTLDSKVLLETKLFSVVSDQVEFPDGGTAERLTVRHPGAVVILPKTESGRLLMIKQYRHPLGETILEFPAGTLEKGEEPLECAKRELIEEAGVSAARWEPLGCLYPAPGFCSEVQHLFLAEELSPDSAPADEDEIIEPVELSLEDVHRAISDNELRDGKSLGVLLRAQLLGFL